MNDAEKAQFKLFLALFAVVILAPFGEEWAKDTVTRWLVCRSEGHTWADDTRYGVEPVCVHCHAERAE